MRYEDISLDIEAAVKKIFKFLRLQYHGQVKEFLETHTKGETGESFIAKDSKSVPFHWKKDFEKNFTFVQNIQSKCAKAMQVWVYAPATDSENLEKLDPLLEPPWPEMNPYL